MEKAGEEEKENNSHQPFEVRLPGFIIDEEVGLGDMIKRATSAFGVRPCGDCNRRANTLNSWIKFSRRNYK